MSLYFTYKALNYKINSYFQYLIFFILYFGVYGLFAIISGSHVYQEHGSLSSGSFIIGVLRSFLPIFASYYFTKKGMLNEKIMKFLFFIFFLLFFYMFTTFSVLKMAESNRDGFTNNLGYLFVSLIPFIYLFKDKLLYQFSFLIVLFGLAVFSMKRGAILIAFLLTLFFIYKEMSSLSKNKKILLFFLTFIGVIISFRYLSDFYADNVYFQSRVEDTLAGDSSNRDIIANQLWNCFNNGSMFNQLIGYGADATLEFTGMFAHNDWLEVLINQGYLGIILYLVYWKKFYNMVKRHPPKSLEYEILVSILIATFFRCFFSMSYSVIPISTSLLLGYAIAQSEIKLNIKNE